MNRMVLAVLNIVDIRPASERALVFTDSTLLKSNLLQQKLFLFHVK